MIEERGCERTHLPPYSPMEEAFSEVKTLLRKAKARSFEALIEATGRTFSAVYVKRMPATPSCKARTLCLLLFT